MSNNIKKCRWKYCPHCKEIDIEKEEYATNEKGNVYYHVDCKKNVDNIEAIKTLWYEEVSKSVVMSHLVKTIHTLILSKNVDSDYLLYALRHAIDKKRDLKSPFYLHYLADDSPLKAKYKAEKKRMVAKKQKEGEIGKIDIEDIHSKDTKFQYKKRKQEGFGNIFGG